MQYFVRIIEFLKHHLTKGDETAASWVKDLTRKDLRFLMLVRLKIPYEGIASIYNIKEESVKQRLFLFKKKLGLEKSKVSTREFIEEY